MTVKNMINNRRISIMKIMKGIADLSIFCGKTTSNNDDELVEFIGKKLIEICYNHI